jgi:hypothetical protein
MTSQQFEHAPLGMEPLSGPGSMMGMSGAATQPLMMSANQSSSSASSLFQPMSSASSSTALFNGNAMPAAGSASSIAPGAAAEMSALHSLALSYARKLDIAVRSGSEDDTALLLCEPLLNPNIKVRHPDSPSPCTAQPEPFFFFFFLLTFFFFFRFERIWTDLRFCTSLLV